MDKHAIFTAEWPRKMVKALQVTGKGERPQEAYVRVVRLVCEHYRKAPDLLAKEELVDYFIHRQQRTGWSPSTMRICYTGIKFFFAHVLRRDWHLLNIARARRQSRLPAVLAQEEVRRILHQVDTIQWVRIGWHESHTVLLCINAGLNRKWRLVFRSVLQQILCVSGVLCLRHSALACGQCYDEHGSGSIMFGFGEILR